MVNKIEWSKTAIAELGKILVYLKYEVSENASEKFADLVKQKLSQLADNTFDGRPVPTRKNVRFILLGKIPSYVLSAAWFDIVHYSVLRHSSRP